MYVMISLLTLVVITALLPLACDVVEEALLFTSFGEKPGEEFPFWGLYMLLRAAWAVGAAIVLGKVKDAVAEKQTALED